MASSRGSPWGIDIGPTPTWEGSPFRGLQQFDFEHEPIFFGRTKAIGEAIDRLKRCRQLDQWPTGYEEIRMLDVA